MPYRFKLDEPLAKGFRRIMSEQIARAGQTHAGECDEGLAVHETRKCIKRMRALLRSFRPVLGEADFRSLNARLRDIAALLSEVRDTRVMLDTVDRLQEGSPVATAEHLEPVRAALVRRLSKPKTVEGKDDASKAIPLLQHFGKRIARIRIADADIERIARGVERSYRDGRKAFRKAFRAESDENFHEWRKLVQQHWRQMHLVSAGWPEYFAARAGLARDLAQTLGDDHDLAMLARFIGTARPPVAKAGNTKKLLGLLAARQAELRAQARLQGIRLYAEGSSDLARRTAAYWHAAAAATERAAPAKRKT